MDAINGSELYSQHHSVTFILARYIAEIFEQQSPGVTRKSVIELGCLHACM
jgi:hypothetical protein